MRGVTIEGEIVEIGSGALDSPGYDLLALVTGLEGMLVVLTEVTVKLVPKPQPRASRPPSTTWCAPATRWRRSSPPVSSPPASR